MTVPIQELGNRDHVVASLNNLQDIKTVEAFEDQQKISKKLIDKLNEIIQRLNSL